MKDKFILTVITIAICLPSANAADPPPIAVTLRISNSEVVVEQDVVIEELIPDTIDIAVCNIQHRVIRIGRYDSSLKSLVSIDFRRYMFANPIDEFTGLPLGIGYSRSLSGKPACASYQNLASRPSIPMIFPGS